MSMRRLDRQVDSPRPGMCRPVQIANNKKIFLSGADVGLTQDNLFIGLAAHRLNDLPVTGTDPASGTKMMMAPFASVYPACPYSLICGIADLHDVLCLGNPGCVS
ncbi:hypothetical protein PILCRDRAFT_821684 [Piloderma croceum F 1598]|uniref:Uncharacterized protein n=1 Tax=Piloderma croceum (strain F 1598) TaxID=765440 RepID=A0A0C3FNC8_PILCF|nr:hypothetical protein PILCRDRAFT_821684 [Piloderma croceum F 1598]